MPRIVRSIRAKTAHQSLMASLSAGARVLPLFKTTLRRQPAGRAFVANRLARRLFRSYFQRIALVIRPRRVIIWPGRDFTKVPTVVDVPRAGRDVSAGAL